MAQGRKASAPQASRRPHPHLHGDVHYPPVDFVPQNAPDPDALYRAAEKDLRKFWAERAERFVWFKQWDQVLDESKAPFFKWFVGGKTNIVHNALDRHVETWRRNKLALVWEGESGEVRTFSYHAMHREVNKFAIVLKSMGVSKGDRVTSDEDGYYWIIGRVDDVLKVSGYRLGTAEIESALVSHPAVAEAAAIGLPHEIKGNAIHTYVILRAGVEPSDALKEELRAHVAHELGPIAKPEEIQFVPSLPKTRSGKIMRRVLKARAQGLPEGDLSTLEE
jgi:acyl-coenzyme A synthetase/AMP-(fatty) acid ligase